MRQGYTGHQPTSGSIHKQSYARAFVRCGSAPESWLALCAGFHSAPIAKIRVECHRKGARRGRPRKRSPHQMASSTQHYFSPYQVPNQHSDQFVNTTRSSLAARTIGH
jgi:hypothetical protein